MQLKRRYDLVPNLVETVRGYAAHERQTFDSVTAARAAAVDRAGPGRAGEGGERAEHHLAQPLRGQRGLPAAAGEPQLRRPAGGAVGHREPDRLRAAVLQRRRAHLQQRRADRADEHRRRTSAASPRGSRSRRPTRSAAPSRSASERRRTSLSVPSPGCAGPGVRSRWRAWSSPGSACSDCWPSPPARRRRGPGRRPTRTGSTPSRPRSSTCSPATGGCARRRPPRPCSTSPRAGWSRSRRSARSCRWCGSAAAEPPNLNPYERMVLRPPPPAGDPGRRRRHRRAGRGHPAHRQLVEVVHARGDRGGAGARAGAAALEPRGTAASCRRRRCCRRLAGRGRVHAGPERRRRRLLRFARRGLRRRRHAGRARGEDERGAGHRPRRRGGRALAGPARAPRRRTLRGAAGRGGHHLGPSARVRRHARPRAPRGGRACRSRRRPTTGGPGRTTAGCGTSWTCATAAGAVRWGSCSGDAATWSAVGTACFVGVAAFMISLFALMLSSALLDVGPGRPDRRGSADRVGRRGRPAGDGAARTWSRGAT